MVEKMGSEVLDKNISQRAQTVSPEGVPNLAHPDFNKIWSAQKNGSPLNDGFHITNGLTSEWLKKLEDGGEHSKADEMLMRAELELRAQMGAGKFSKLLDRVDNTPPFQIGNLAKDGKLGEFFDPKETGSLKARDLITAAADPNRSETEHTVALALIQHFFTGKELDDTIPISQIQKATDGVAAWK